MPPGALESEMLKVTSMSVGKVVMRLTFVHYFVKLASLPILQSTHPLLKYKCLLNTYYSQVQGNGDQ